MATKINVNRFMEPSAIKDALCHFVERPFVSVHKRRPRGVNIRIKHRIGVRQAYGNREALEHMGFHLLFYFHGGEDLPYNVRVWIE